MHRRTLLLAPLLLPVLGLAARPAQAAPAAFDAAAFAAAQAAGAPILLWVHADWCPTCKAQAPILARLEAEPRFRDLRVFVVDFDRQKDVVRNLRVTMQSTLIAFHGRTERARSTGQTSEAALREVVGAAVG